MDDEVSDPRSGQRKGGRARSERLTPEERSEIAARAAQARWNRETAGVNLANVEDFQMNTDAIDAADVLVTELSEQTAQLSQSGVNALTNGHFAEAKVIIHIIEQTEAFRKRAEQLKVDMVTLQSGLFPDSSLSAETVFPQENLETIARRQERTDPVLMNEKRKEILHHLENKYRVRLHRRSAAIYRSDNNEIGIVCAMSKWHVKNENYWYAYHPHQDAFLGAVGEGFFVLGMMDSDAAVVLPVAVIRENQDKLNTTTTPGGRTYWHIHMSRSGTGTLSLQRARGEPPLLLDHYIVEITR
jgi:hypothetical protein